MGDLWSQARTTTRHRRGQWWDVAVVSNPERFDYDELLALSVATGTTDISLQYDKETPDRSELTPGDPSSLDIVVWLRVSDPQPPSASTSIDVISAVFVREAKP